MKRGKNTIERFHTGLNDDDAHVEVEEEENVKGKQGRIREEFIGRQSG